MITKDFGNAKVRITSEEEARNVQEKLEGYGYEFLNLPNYPWTKTSNTLYIFDKKTCDYQSWRSDEKYKELSVDEILNDSCKHNKVYSNIVLTSYPAQYPWICSKCGEKGTDGCTFQTGETYDELVKKFEKKTLWDKMQKIELDKRYMINKEDIEEALKDYIKAMTDKLHLHKTFEDIAKEIFGEELIEE